MKKFAVAVLLFLTVSFVQAQTDTITVVLDYASSNCSGALPNQSSLSLLDEDGNNLDNMVVNYSGGAPVGSPTSSNGLIIWDGILSNYTWTDLKIVGGLDSLYILVSYVIDNCPWGGTSTSPTTATSVKIPINKDYVDSQIADSTYWRKTGNYVYPNVITDSVGINQTTPGALLEVDGTVIVGDALIKSGSGITSLMQQDVSSQVNDYALWQNSSGATRLNAATGQYIIFANGNSQRGLLDGTGLRLDNAFGSATERLHVDDNFRLGGAFMPGNVAGPLGSILMGGGANNPNIWMDTTGVFGGGGGSGIDMGTILYRSDGLTIDVSGLTDTQRGDTLQYAIETAPTNQFLAVPPGIYEGEFLWDVARLTMYGYGKSEVVMTCSTAHTLIVDMGSNLYRGDIKDIQIMSYKNGAADYDAIHFTKVGVGTSTSNFYIDGVHISEADRDGIRIDNTVSIDNLFLDFKITDAFDVGGYAIYNDNTNVQAVVIAKDADFYFGANASDNQIFVNSNNPNNFTVSRNGGTNNVMTNTSHIRTLPDSLDGYVHTPLVQLSSSELIYYNPLDALDGTTSYDLKFGNDGTTSGDPVEVLTGFGTAIEFDGNDKIEVAHSTDYDSDDLFLSVMFKAKADVAQRIARRNSVFDIKWDVGGDLEIQITKGAVTTARSVAGLVIDQWYHVSCGYSSITGEMDIALNGVIISSSTGLSGTVDKPTNGIGIGVFGHGGSSSYFTGIIKEFYMCGSYLPEYHKAAYGMSATNRALLSKDNQAAATPTWTQASGYVHPTNVTDDVIIGSNITPVTQLQIAEAGSGDTYIRIQNSTTGYTSSDGLRIGMKDDETGWIMHHENEPIRFGTNNLEKMRLSELGYLGIGETNPSEILHIYSGTQATMLFESNNNASVNIRSFDSNPSASLKFEVAAGSRTTPTSMVTGKSLGSIQFKGFRDSDSDFAAAATIKAVTTENYTGAGVGAEIQFHTAKNGFASASQKMVLFNDGELQLDNYGSGAVTSTLTQLSGWDTNGMFMEPTPADVGTWLGDEAGRDMIVFTKESGGDITVYPSSSYVANDLLTDIRSGELELMEETNTDNSELGYVYGTVWDSDSILIYWGGDSYKTIYDDRFSFRQAFMSDIWGVDYWCDSVYGDDANSGLSPDQALRSIEAAKDKADVATIRVKSGNYYGPNGFDQYISNDSLNIVGYGGPVIVGAAVDATFTVNWQYDNVYQTFDADLDGVISTRNVDEYGMLVSYEEVTSILEVSQKTSSYYYVTDTMYVNSSATPATGDDFYLLGGSDGVLMATGAANAVVLYMEGLTFINGADATVDEVGNKLYAYECNFIHMNGEYRDGLLDISGLEDVFLNRCIAGNSDTDGFNYHDALVVVTKPVTKELNCIVYDVGKGLTGAQDQASSVHEDWRAIRINGDYKGAYQTFYDVNESWSINIGNTVSIDKDVGLYNYGLNGNTDAQNMWIVNPKVGVTNSMSALIGNCTMYLSGVNYTSLDLQGVGTYLIR